MHNVHVCNCTAFNTSCMYQVYCLVLFLSVICELTSSPVNLALRSELIRRRRAIATTLDGINSGDVVQFFIDLQCLDLSRVEECDEIVTSSFLRFSSSVLISIQLLTLTLSAVRFDLIAR
jgi:hypothetical protein